MALEVSCGGGAPDSRGLPLGCVGYSNPLTICSAELSSVRKCGLCQRTGDFPAPSHWRGQLAHARLKWPSVQVVPSALPSLPWLVLVVVSADFIDGRWPIIGAPSAGDAHSLALARARQLRPRAVIERSGDGYRAGDLPILLPVQVASAAVCDG